MTSRLDELWARLAHYQIVRGSRPGLHLTDTPWYIKLLLAISGWIAAFFLIAFVTSVFSSLLKSVAACTLFGTALLVLAYYALRYRRQEFFEHTGIALSLAGQAFIVYAIAKTLSEQFALAALLIATLEILLFVVMRSYVHRIFCALAASLAFYLAFNFTTLEEAPTNLSGVNHAFIIAAYAFFVAWLWLNEFRYIKNYEHYHALVWGISIALVSLGTVAIFSHAPRAMSNEHDALTALNWLGEVLLSLVLVWIVARILKRKENLSPRIKFACFFSVFTVDCL